MDTEKLIEELPLIKFDAGTSTLKITLNMVSCAAAILTATIYGKQAYAGIISRIRG